MGNHLSEITQYLWRQSWQLALLIVIVAGVSWLLRNRSAHGRYLLWLIVLAKCLVPPFLTVPLAILPVEKTAEPLPPLPVGQPLVVPAVSSKAGNRSAAMPSICVKKDTSQATTSRLSIPSADQVLGVVWIAGMATFGGVAITKVVRSNLRLRWQRSALPDDLQANVGELLRGFGMKSHPRVWLLDGVGQPFVWGLLRGEIYLPTDYLRIDNAAHRRDILGHEVCHILRWDAAINSLQVLAQALFWFHPLVWWANQKMRMEREKCCDEMAVAHLGAGAKEYSTAIVKALITEHESARPVPSLAVAGPVKDVEERIRTMLRPGKTFYRRPSLIAAITVLLLAFSTVPTALMLTTKASQTQEGEVLAYDDFDGKLNLKWEILHPDPTRWSLSKNPGTLTITTQDGTFNRGRMDYKNLFLIDCPTAQGQDFQITTCVSNFEPLEEWNQAGVILWNGDNDNLKLAYEWHEAMGLKPQRVFTTASDTEKAGKEVFSSGCFRANQNLKKIWLRMTKQGNKYMFYTSPDGKSFTTLGAPNWERMDVFDGVRWGEGTVKRMGLFANNGSRNGASQIDGSFDFFEVRSLLPPEREVKAEKSLHGAVATGDIDQVKSLISKGVNVNEKTTAGNTPLHYAARQGHRGVAEVLIAAGADVKAIDKNGQTPLHIASWHRHKELVELLLANGADPGAKTRWDETPLHHAATGHYVPTMKQTDVAEVLVARGANINAKDSDGWTPLHRAVNTTYKAMTELLIAKGADINAKDSDGCTPLHWVTRRGGSQIHREMAQLLISGGADINTKNNNGQTPLEIAFRRGRTRMAVLLAAEGAEVSSIFVAAAFGDLAKVKAFLESGIDVNTKADEGPTPLHLAAQGGHKEVAELLISKHADVNGRDEADATPLHFASGAGHRDVAELLIAKGADINARYGDGETPLHWAAWEGHKEVAELLIAKGAGVNTKTKEGRTALHEAATQGHRSIVELLIGKNADVNTKDNQGRTALQLAKENGHTEIVELLKKHGAKE